LAGDVAGDVAAIRQQRGMTRHPVARVLCVVPVEAAYSVSGLEVAAPAQGGLSRDATGALRERAAPAGWRDGVRRAASRR